MVNIHFTKKKKKVQVSYGRRPKAVFHLNLCPSMDVWGAKKLQCQRSPLK